MEKGNHTPGPHRVEQIGRRPVMVAVAATVISSAGERLADFRHVGDANLFSSSSDLFDAMQKVLETLSFYEGSESRHKPSAEFTVAVNVEDFTVMLSRVRASLEKPS